MSLCLRLGISFCRVGDRLIFLDIIADRYFCLSAAAERAIEQVTEGAERPRPAEGIASLIAQGVLIERDGCEAPMPCVCPSYTGGSFLDARLPRVSFLPTMVALHALGLARLRLKVLGLRATLTALERRKARVAGDPPNTAEQLERTVAAFERASRIATTLDHCLSQSVAVAGRLLTHGIRPKLVIGVRLGPFNAHCWVQHENRLVNDRMDMVRMFTPILVI